MALRLFFQQKIRHPLQRTKRHCIAWAIDHHVIRQPVPRLGAVSVEINAACNRKCLLCPNHDHDRGTGRMEEKLFEKIINDLAVMRFAGDFGFSFFNEPLLDTRLADYARRVKTRLPRGRLYLNTNGDLLDWQRFTQLRDAGIVYFNITQYDGAASAKIQDIIARITPAQHAMLNVHVLQPATINNRAGSILLENSPADFLRGYCERPFRQLIITWEGMAVLCCNDYFGSVRAGNAATQSIRDIWQGPVFAAHRRALLREDRSHLVLCKKCSTID